ncbi:MAG: hypothetical protein KIT61_11585 [Pyrinomonadaceae bacterium]|nr:hypothetical protein [Blastocatellia bacterium]MCW5957218.1 hypothetical protein [Pyrinomonadaceae bacterium]
MMFGILGIVAIVVFTIQVYKTANGTGRNGALWALLTAAVGFGFQLVIPFVFGLVIAIVYLVSGSSPESLESDINLPASLIGIAGIVISIIGMVLISKHVAKVPDEPPMAASTPPPPPSF